MSWKATAYVKEITKGINPSEKLMLFVLADYHNTAKKVAWPSLPLLASEALMSERNASRILISLESKGFIQRVVFSQRGKTSCYRFLALDGITESKDDNLSTLPEAIGMTKIAIKDDSKDDTAMSDAIRKNGFEPSTTGKELSRDEIDRRSRWTEARKRWLRDFDKFPLEPWEEPLTTNELSMLAKTQRAKAKSA